MALSPPMPERLFEPFFSTQPTGKGTGLGLAQVYGLFKQSRGRITVDSAEGEGISLILYLPAAEERP